MKVSIIIPIYNTGEKLRRCLDSVLEQDYFDYECIMVNDGSTDISGHIIDEYSNQDNRFIAIHKANGGVGSARNKGLEVAKGEWIVFVDSDDILLTDHLSSMLFSASDDIDLVLTGFRFLHSKDVTDHKYHEYKYLGHDSVRSFLSNTDFLEYQIPWDKMYRNKYKGSNDRMVFDENLSLGEDRLFCYNYLMHCSGIVTIGLITYIHDGTDENSLSYKTYSSAMNEYRYECFKSAEKNLLSFFGLGNKYVLDFFRDYNEGIYASLINSFRVEGKMFSYYKTRILHKLGLL